MTSFSKAKNSDVIYESIQAAITTLGARSTNIINSFDDGSVNLEMTFRILATDYIISLNGWETELADGPVIVGMVERKTDQTAVSARLNVNGPIEPNDDTAKDIVNDRVWNFVSFDGDTTKSGQSFMGRKTIRWTFPVGADSAGWNWFAYNASGSAMNAENKQIKIFATHYGVWVT